MLTEQENEELTRVGPGTPCGELLRRYWHPVCVASELTPDRPKRRIRLLGEDVVVYQDLSGGYGLVAEHCSHRGASLYYGFVEDGGIRCPYHGWLYDKAGECLEQPFEPKESMMRYAVRHPAYPVEKLGGLLFAYLGPQPAPLAPRWDVLVREDGERTIEIHRPLLNCNWLQCQENVIDPTHNYYLHGQMGVRKGLRPRGSARAPERYTFQVSPWGIIQRSFYGGDGKAPLAELGRPTVFPNLLWHWVEPRDGASALDGCVPMDMQYRVPIDDTHTEIIFVNFVPSKNGPPGPLSEDPPAIYIDVKNEEGEFHLDNFPSQDFMAWETQGPISDRAKEHLGIADTGIVMWRKLLKEQIEVVRRGDDPIGVIRDPAKNQIIELGPSRVRVGDQFVPKPWAGWGEGWTWESPKVWIGHEAVEAASNEGGD